MGKTLKIIGITVLMLILFRGIVFRLVVKYDEIGNRARIEITNKNLLEEIEKEYSNRGIGLEEILVIADLITKKKLEFTTNQVSSNPNELINTNKANCIGYSAMYNSIANYLIEKGGLKDEIEAKHKIGRIELLGIDIHQFFDNPFFRNHDFNEITNKKTGENFSIDPTVSDYLWIRRISRKK